MHLRLRRIVAAGVWIFSTAAVGQQEGEIVVTAASNLPGLAVAPDRLPTGSETLESEALRRGGTTNLLRALDALAAGVSLDDAQDNPWQPNLLYRGYEASPLGGNAQGLAVYVDGARFNQPFGDGDTSPVLSGSNLPAHTTVTVALKGRRGAPVTVRTDQTGSA